MNEGSGLCACVYVCLCMCGCMQGEERTQDMSQSNNTPRPLPQGQIDVKCCLSRLSVYLLSVHMWLQHKTVRVISPL